MSDADGFLSRWSRRKRGAEAEDAPEPVVETADPEPTAPEGETEEEALARLGLPDPDTLSKGDDFSAFLKAVVPEAIRRRALRRLWRSNPTLAVLDGLNDYDDDFTGGFVKPGALSSAYEVGRGFAGKVRDAVEAVEQVAEAEDAEPEAPHAAFEEQSAEAATPPDDVDEAHTDTDESAPIATRRRMAFRVPHDGT